MDRRIVDSGENLSDVELTEEELEAIDYSDMVNSIISLITEPVNVTVSNVGQLLNETVAVLITQFRKMDLTQLQLIAFHHTLII